jgi:uridine phosphorylase
MEKAMFVIEPQDVRSNAVARGVDPEDLLVPDAVVITFNRSIIGEFARLCNLCDWDWQATKYMPYGSPQTCMKGEHDEMELALFVPPMGASPIAAFCDELIAYGARTILLLCASWSLGEEYLQKGQIHLPSFAVGMDGTSFHYGNTTFRVDADPTTLEILTGLLDEEGVVWKQGGVGCCEAFYRITREMVEDYRKQGCLSMENGEVAALYSLAKSRGIHAGVLLQPYLDLERGIDLSYVDEKYHETCIEQARIALKALRKFHEVNA